MSEIEKGLLEDIYTLYPDIRAWLSNRRNDSVEIWATEEIARGKVAALIGPRADDKMLYARDIRDPDVIDFVKSDACWLVISDAISAYYKQAPMSGGGHTADVHQKAHRLLDSWKNGDQLLVVNSIKNMPPLEAAYIGAYIMDGMELIAKHSFDDPGHLKGNLLHFILNACD